LLNEWRAPAFQSAVFLPDGTLLSGAPGQSNGPTSLSFSDPKTGTLKSTVPLIGMDADCVAVITSPDGRLAVTGHNRGSLALWDAQSGRLLHVARGKFENRGVPLPVDVLAISADGGLLFGGTSAHVAMKTWSLRDFRELGHKNPGENYPLHCATAPDGSQIATAGLGQGQGINIWDGNLRHIETRLQGQEDFLDALAYAPDGRTLVAVEITGRVILWNLPTGRQLGILMTLPQGIRCEHLAFSPDGSWLGMNDTSGVLHLFHAPLPAENQ
jgi:WD40 repeat protein